MNERGLLFIVVLLLLSFKAIPSIASPTTSPSTPRPTAEPCQTAVPELPNDLTAAFAYEIISAPLLRFLSWIKSVPERNQKLVFDRVAAAAKTTGQHELEVAEQSVCPTLEQIYGQTRALIFVSNEWPLGELHDNAKFGDFATVVSDAITALVIGDALTVEQHQWALLPFAGLTAPQVAQPGSANDASCAQPSATARTLHAVAPQYPAMAGAAGTGGTIQVLVSLNESGDVRSEKSLASNMGDRLGAEDAVRAAILSAAASTYAPEIRNCEPVGGKYIFVVKFNRR